MSLKLPLSCSVVILSKTVLRNLLDYPSLESRCTAQDWSHFNDRASAFAMLDHQVVPTRREADGTKVKNEFVSENALVNNNYYSTLDYYWTILYIDSSIVTFLI